MVKKYVLLVDEREGELTACASELKAMGYDVVRVAELRAALNAIATLDRLSLVVVNCGTAQRDYEAFLSSVRSLHPELPVLWLTDAKEAVTAFLKQPVATVADQDGPNLRLQASRLLRDEFYSSEIVGEVSDLAQQVLAEFGVKTARSEPYIKSNLTLLSDVNALMGFSGEGLSGHLIVSATADDARAVYRNSAPDQRAPEYDDLEDLMGEVTNRVLGRIKRVFESRGLSFKLRPPSFIRGPQARYRNKASCPSLAIEFSDHGGMLRMEFCIDRMNPLVEVPMGNAEFVESGEITFL